MNLSDIELELKDMFEDNYTMLRLEGGHALTADTKEAAWKQVLYYYRKLRKVAESVSETEVKLTLPEQFTKLKRRFTIEGVVDIVTEQEEVWMYDIKTHDADYIRSNKKFYENQLNVYAYIWEELRKEKLDQTAIISTALPRSLRTALETDNPVYINKETEKWEPVIPIDYDHSKVQETINDFARVVDNIENHTFEPKPVEGLYSKLEGSNTTFATRNCSNCDGRFSCSSYREYAIQSGAKTSADFKKYYEEYRDEADQEAFINANLSARDQLPDTSGQ